MNAIVSGFVISILAIVAWGAFAFGAILWWAYWPLLASCTAVGGWGLITARRRAATTPHGLTIAIGLVALGILVQLIPLPAPVIDRVSPASAAFDQRIDAAPISRPLSIAPARTAQALVFFAAFAIFFLGMRARLTPADVRVLAIGVVVIGALLALSGTLWHPDLPNAVEELSDGADLIGSAAKASRTDDVEDTFGPFGNRNHFGGWMLMALPLAMCALAGLWQKPLARVRTLGFLAASILLMSLSVVLTASRSALACLALAVALIAVIIRRNEKQHQPILLKRYVAFITLLVIVAAGTGGLGAAMSRYAQVDDDWGGRRPIWRDATRIVADFPLTGTGLSTYEQAAARYGTTVFRQQAAHNDYLQVAAEGGLLIGIPLLCLAVTFAREVWRHALNARAGSLDGWLRKGAVVGLIALAAQEFVEFSVQMPGNAALFIVLCAIAVYPPYDHARTSQDLG